MCCSQFAGAELENFSGHLWLKGSQGIALGHFSAHDTMKVPQGWFRPHLCLSGGAFHVFNTNTTWSSRLGCQDPVSAHESKLLSPHFLYSLIKQQFSAFGEVSEGSEWSPSEGSIPAKAQESPRGACWWNHCSTISSARPFCEELQHLTCSICQNNCTSQWFLSLHSLF